MNRILALAVIGIAFCTLTAVGDDKKELKLPDLKAKEWVEVKDGGGLKTWDVKEGKGDAVKAGATVKVHYTGWLLDGTIFDSSVQRKEPIEFSLNEVIKGWTNGVPGMKPGAVRRLYIPAALAYGARGAGKAVPPNSDLVFEIELLEIK
jgi:FKBP-type peptidyl-prolyl cis-trans isomerase